MENNENNDLRDHTDSLNKRKGWKSLIKALAHLWVFRHQVRIVLLYLLLAKVAITLVPITLKEIVDWLNPSLHPDELSLVPIFLIIAVGLLCIATTLFEQLRNVLFSQTQLRTVRSIGLQVFRHLHQLSHAFHQKQPTGRLARDIESGIRGINRFFWHFVLHLVPTVFGITLIGIVLVIVFELKFVLITAATLLAYCCFTYYVTFGRRQFREHMDAANFRASTTSFDTLSHFETVKYFCNEEYENKRFDLQMQEWEKQSHVSEQSLVLLNVGQGMIVAIGTIVLLYLAGKGVANDNLTLGQFIMLTAFLVQMYLPVRSLGTISWEVHRALGDMERMFDLLDIEDRVPEIQKTQGLNVSDAEIRFENVSFGYAEDRQLLLDVSFEVSSGQKVAIVGENGAGKLTLVRILFRFYEINTGRIFIDNQNIRDVSLQSLRSSIGVVTQDTILFNDTVEFNIRYGAPTCTDSEFTAAVKQANLSEFIESLPEKHDTIVGDRGFELSSVDKQRIAIARNILKNPSILVLDEPTSSLNLESEKIIQTELDALSKNRTTLVIPHRLSSIVDADMILVLDQGKIAEQGTHAELLEMHGLFENMWWLQQVEETTGAQIAELSANISQERS